MAGGNELRLAVALNGYGLETAGPDGPVRQVVDWNDLLQVVQVAEETGFEAVFTPEIAAREAFSTLAGFAAVTSEVGLATGVARIDRRDVQATAMAAATLDDISGGRFVLGLGSGGSIDETRRFVRQLRLALGNEDAGSPPGAIAGIDLAAPDVPISLAALGPRMTELAGEVADGVILNWCTPERVSEAREQVARGAAGAGRDPSRCVVSVYVRACLGHDRAHALAGLRQTAARYAAMPKYRRQFEAMGLGAEAEAAGSGDGGDVPEALLRAVCVWGTREQALDRLAAYGRAGADLVVIYPVPVQDALSSIMGTLLATAPDPSVEH